MVKPTGAGTRRNPCRRAALVYAGLGWSVLPVRGGEKRPLIAWTELQARRADADEVRDWYRQWPDANVGVVTGAISNLLVLDIDPGHGGDDSLTGWSERHGPLPDTVTARTGGGGRHYYFAHPGGEVRNRAAIAPGIDLRGDGGMVVAPPSRHPSGRRYAWADGHDPESLALAPPPAWLLRLLGRRPPLRGHPLPWWRALVRAGVGEGGRNSTIASLTGHLLYHGVDREVLSELLLCWNRVRCRPPLDDAEVLRTIDSIIRTHERGEQAERTTPPRRSR